ncbi:MAG: hypothetical protein AAF360_13780, partial [Pseudomonadota bacterium]
AYDPPTQAELTSAVAPLATEASIAALNDVSAADVWAAASRTLTDKAGFELTPAERAAIATAVEQSILNEGDGQQVLNAIVGAIGNTNIDEVAFVAAIRADLERAGGAIDLIETRAEADARQITLIAQHGATLSAIGGLNDISAAQVRTEVDASVANLTVDLAPVTSAIADLDSDVANLSADVANISISTADVQAGLNANGYTVTRSALIDNLDAAISSRSTFNPVNDTVANVTNVQTNADMRGTDNALLALGYAAPLSAAATTAAVEAADLTVPVTAAFDAQGYTTARAGRLDNADVATSTRLAASSYAPPDLSDLATQADIAALANSTINATLTGPDSVKLDEAHRFLGLDQNATVTITETGTTTTGINITVANDGTQAVLTRQP